MTRTTKIILAGTTTLVLIALTVTVKMVFFPSVKDTWFQLGGQRWRQVPPGLVVVRPTHFPKSPTNDFSNAKQGRWKAGRNVTLPQLFAAAYNYNPGRVYLPPTAPKNNYDFLVTALSGSEEHLRAAIEKKTGYTASVETRDMDVLALKVEDPNSTGLTIAAAGEKSNVSPKNGRLYFTHMKLNVVTDGMEHMVNMPVVDKTGLTNYYDFSLAWDAQTQRQIQSGTLDSETGKKILAEWGLGLEPDTASIEMLVVKRAN